MSDKNWFKKYFPKIKFLKKISIKDLIDEKSREEYIKFVKDVDRRQTESYASSYNKVYISLNSC